MWPHFVSTQSEVPWIENCALFHNRIDGALRVCTLCDKSDLEDEYHFVLVCSVYDSIRKKYIRPFYYKRPRVYKFRVLMQNKQLVNVLRNLGKHLSRAMRKCVLCHMRTTKAQISLRIRAVWSAPLLFAA